MDRTITFTRKELTLLANILRSLEPIRRGQPPEPIDAFVRPQPNLKSHVLNQMKANGVPSMWAGGDHTDEFATALGKIEAAKWKSSHDQDLLR